MNGSRFFDLQPKIRVGFPLSSGVACSYSIGLLLYEVRPIVGHSACSVILIRQ